MFLNFDKCSFQIWGRVLSRPQNKKKSKILRQMIVLLVVTPKSPSVSALLGHKWNLAACSFSPIWIGQKTPNHNLYDTISLQYECPIILKPEMVSGTFDVQKSHRNIVHFENLLCKGAVAKSFRWDLFQLLSLSWCESGSVHDPHNSPCCPC